MSSYKRKSDRKLVFTEQLMAEIRNKINNGQSKRSISRELNIPEATLRKRLKIGTVPVSLGRYKCIFSEQQEKELAKYVQEMDCRFYGLTMKDLTSIAFEFAKANGVEHNFNAEKKVAGKTWIRCFCERQKITLRQPEKCSLGRMIGFNRSQVDLFFKNLRDMYQKYNFASNFIYNMDETGISTVPNKLPKVFTQKGKKCVGKVASGERGQLVTAVCCMSAGGIYVPPALIFPRKRMKEELYTEAPLGTLPLISESGFINSELFLQWMKHFQKHVKASKDAPVLLVLDNHSSHRSLNVIKYCRESSIHLLSLPPHASHKMQPLDKGYFGPLKTAYSQATDNWLVTNPGKAITQKQVAGLFKTAYYKVSNLDKAVKAFEATGIWPYNPDHFNEEDFAPSLVTDKPYNVCEEAPDAIKVAETAEIPMELDQIIAEETEVLEIDFDASTGLPVNPEYAEQMETSIIKNSNAPETDNQNNLKIYLDMENGMEPGPFYNISQTTPPKQDKAPVKPEDLRPYPKCRQTEQTRKRRSQKSEILTSTPLKDELEAKQTELTKKVKRKIGLEKSAKPAAKNSKQRNTAKASTSKINSNNTERNDRQKPSKPEECKGNKNETEKILCPLCDTLFTDPPSEDWIQCSKCNTWWHEKCTSYEAGNFTCELC